MQGQALLQQLPGSLVIALRDRECGQVVERRSDVVGASQVAVQRQALLQQLPGPLAVTL